MDDCVALARAFGERIAARFDLPVYLYAQAAARPERVKLSDVRRGQYEGLKAEIDQRGREPDFGPARMHPSAGAVAVGARPFLIAYNINLASEDVELAKRIARRVRESGGGLPKVQGNGFWIEELRRAQVSMNLLDFSVTPLWLVWETVREIAAEDGVDLAESELIGLAPARLAPRRRRPRGRPVRRSRSTTGSRRPRRSCDCATSRRSRPWSSAWRRPGPGQPPVSGGFRVIEGGRSEEPSPGPPDRRGGRGRDDGRRRPGRAVAGRDRPPRRRHDARTRPPGSSPVVACWEGRIAAVGPRAEGRGGARGRGLPARPLRPDRCRRAGSSRRASSTRTRTCCSAARARTS